MVAGVVGAGAESKMVHDSIVSPHRRAQTQTAFSVSSPTVRKQQQHLAREELGSCSTLIKRHRFLLTALILLAFLCTIYLYFAVTLGGSTTSNSCSGLTGPQRTSCHLKHAKSTLSSSGKLRFLWKILCFSFSCVCDQCLVRSLFPTSLWFCQLSIHEWIPLPQTAIGEWTAPHLTIIIINNSDYGFGKSFVLFIGRALWLCDYYDDKQFLLSAWPAVFLLMSIPWKKTLSFLLCDMMINAWTL